MRKILFDIDRGKTDANVSLDFSITSEKYTNFLMDNFSKYFDRKLGIGCLRIFITEYELQPNEFKLGIDPVKDKKDLKALGILIFRINKSLENWLEMSEIEKSNFIKDLWLTFFIELPEIVYLGEKNNIINSFKEIQKL